MYSKMPGTWYAMPSTRVNSNNVINIQADVVHRRMLNLSYSVERLTLARRHHVRMSSTLHSTLVSSQSGYLTGLEASVHTISTGESVTMNTIQLGSFHLVDIRILDI